MLSLRHFNHCAVLRKARMRGLRSAKLTCHQNNDLRNRKLQHDNAEIQTTSRFSHTRSFANVFAQYILGVRYRLTTPIPLAYLMETPGTPPSRARSVRLRVQSVVPQLSAGNSRPWTLRGQLKRDELGRKPHWEAGTVSAGSTRL